MSDESHSEADEAHDDETHPDDAEQTEFEWHIWLITILVVGGIVLVFFPTPLRSEFGFALVGLAVIGWILKTVLERTER